MAKLSKIELERVNKQLVEVGERICPGCYQRKPLTDEFWYWTTRNSGRPRGQRVVVSRCRVCHSAATSENSRKRYRDPVLKARKDEMLRLWRQRNADKVRAASKRYRINRAIRRAREAQ